MTDTYERSEGFVYTRSLALDQSEEPGVVTSQRQFSRYLERLDACKEPWAPLWLAGAGLAGGLACSSLIGLLTLPTANLKPGTKAVMVVLLIAGLVLCVVCTIAYLSRRSSHSHQIDQLKKDMGLLHPEQLTS